MRVYDKNNKLVFEEKHNIFLSPSRGSNYWLREVYSKTNENNFEVLIESLLKFVKEPDKYQEEFYLNVLKFRIGFRLVPEGQLPNPCFDPLTANGLTIIPIQMSQINFMQTDLDYKQRYIKCLKSMITHEDTHKQQFDRYWGYSKNYKIFSSENPFKLLSKEDVDYFSQPIEADAYARQVGSTIRKIYETESAEKIFDNIINKNILEDIQDLIDVYRDPRISRKGYKHFWTTLYNYLKDNERDLEESLKISLEKILKRVK